MFADAALDLRGYMIALLSVIITHSVLISTVLKFEKYQMAFQMSFPVSIRTRFFQCAFFYLLLLLPELLLYIDLTDYSIFSASAGILFCISGLLTLRMSLYFFENEMELNIGFVFCYAILVMLAILYNQFFAFSLLQLAISMIYFTSLFYKSKL